MGLKRTDECRQDALRRQDQDKRKHAERTLGPISQFPATKNQTKMATLQKARRLSQSVKNRLNRMRARLDVTCAPTNPSESPLMSRVR